MDIQLCRAFTLGWAVTEGFPVNASTSRYWSKLLSHSSSVKADRCPVRGHPSLDTIVSG